MHFLYFLVEGNSIKYRNIAETYLLKESNIVFFPEVKHTPVLLFVICASDLSFVKFVIFILYFTGSLEVERPTCLAGGAFLVAGELWCSRPAYK